MPDVVAPAVVTASPAVGAISPMVIAKPVETFAQQMEKFGGFTDAVGNPAVIDATPSAPAPDAADAKLAAKKGKKGAKGAAKVEQAIADAAPAAAANAAPAVDKLEQLKALAAELEMDFDGAKVAIRERVEFREAKDRLRKQIEQQEAEVLRRLDEAKTQFSTKLTKADQIEKAYEAGDYDGLAKLLGPNDWNALQEEMIAKISDPNYKRLRELERKDQEREAENQRVQQMHQNQANHRARSEALATHTANLQAQMKASTDPLVREMHDDPLFVNSVIAIQQQNWDGKSTVSPEKAIRMAADGFAAPVAQHMKGLYDKLHRVFGATPQQAAAIVAAVAPVAEATVDPAAPKTGKTNRTAVVPTTGADVASAPKVFQTKKEKDAEFTRRLQEAIAEEHLGVGR